MDARTAQIIKRQQAKLRAELADRLYAISEPIEPEPFGLPEVLADINARFGDAGKRFQRLDGGQ